ncbi:oligosaccharide flippase family protein [Halogeometricum pallidum]|uniref:oligosaccharide flippase family protein n=1 Tax=Halogeometricum pallidum TaxID=411361 RepID=UPI0019552953|nr:oligosaccharide flippase family protein [Halogeometricum pallidum]
MSGETLSGTTAQVIKTIVGFFGTIVFARVLGPTGYGAFFLLLSLATIANRPLAGWSEAVKKRFSEEITEQNRADLFGSVFLVSLSVSLVVVGLTALLSEPLIEYAGVDDAPLLFVLLFAITGTYSMIVQTTQGRGLVSVTIWTKTLNEIIAVPIQILLVLSGFGMAGMVYGYVTALVVVSPILFYYIAVVPSMPSRDTLSSLWSYAAYSIPNAFLGKIYSRFDILLLGALLTPAAAGYYEAALRVSAPAVFVSTVIGSALHPRVSHLLSQGSDPGEDIQNTLGYTSIFAFPLFFGSLSVAGPLITTIYGADFAPAASLLVGLAVFQLFYSQTTVLINVASGWDRPDVVTRLSVVALTTNIILGVLLTREFGPIGVVVSTILAESFRYLGLIRFVSTKIQLSALFPRPMFEQLGASVVMFVVVTGLVQAISLSSTIQLVLVIAVGAVIYFALLFLISKQHRITAISSLEATFDDRFQLK